jgi:hypothetical protein
MSVTAGVPFTFTGSISGYVSAPNLTYSINGAPAVILPGVTAIGWSTTLTVPSAGTYTIAVTDGSGTSGSVTFVASSAQESADKTDITTVGPTINASPNPGTAGSGNIIAITSGGQVSVNGVVIAATSGVTELYYSSHTAYQFNGTNWFGPITAGNGGTLQSTNPKSPESAQNTDITAAGPTINASPTPGTAGSGNIIAITAGGQVSVNGVVITATNGVTELYYTNHTAYQFNGNSWFGPVVAGNGGTLQSSSPKVRNYLVGLRDGNPVDTTTAGLLGYPWEYTINFSYEDHLGGGSTITGLAVTDRPGTSVIVAVYHLDTGTAPYMDAVVAANGGYNAFYTTTAQSLVQYANIIHAVRIDHEFNGTWEPWSPFGGTGQIIAAATWIAGWRNMATAIRTALPNAKIIWNPNIGQNNPYPYYPGDDLVDLIGIDIYTQPAFSGTSTSAQVWQDYLSGQNGSNLTAMAAFGVAHSKPLCFPEWGDGFGDGFFITQFGAWMDQNNVVAHSYWDSADGLTNTTALTQLPQNQAAFVKAFGRPYTGTYWPSLVAAGGIQPPQQARAQGFTNQTGGAEFNSTSDVTNDISGGTVAALYNWDGGSQAMPTNGWHIANGLLTLTAGTNHGQGLESICNTGAPISIGPVSTNGRQTNTGRGMLYRYFYMEASIRFNWQAGPSAAFWTWAYNNGGAPNTLELDIVEVGTDSNVFSFWHGHGAGGDDGPIGAPSASLNGNLTSWAVPNQQLHKSNTPAVFNTYGLLWTPAKVEWYYNDVLIQNFATNTPIPWSTGGNQTANTIDNLGRMALAAIFGTYGELIDVEWFRVWQ